MAIDPQLIFNSTIQALILSVISNLLAQFFSCYRDARSFELDAPKLARYVTYTLLSAPPNLYWQSWLESTFPRYTNADVSGTTTQLANDPNVKSATEAVAPAVDLVKDKTNSVSTAIAHDPNVQTLSRRVTAGVDRVKAQARAIKERYGSAPAASSMQKAVTRSDTAQAATDTLSSLQSGEKDALLDRNHAAAKEQKLNIKNTAIKFAFDQTFGAVINNLLFIIGINLLQGMSWEYIRADIQQNFLHIMFTGQKIWPAVSIMQFSLVPLKYRALVGGIVGIGWGVFLNLTK